MGFFRFGHLYIGFPMARHLFWTPVHTGVKYPNLGLVVVFCLERMYCIKHIQNCMNL